MEQNTEASQAVAPWPDYNGNAIHHGDRLVHPDGNTFVAIKLEGYDDVSDAWRAIYDYDPSHLSRLILEIGNKGRAALKAQPAPTILAKPVKYEQRFVSPQGIAAVWHDAQAETFHRHRNNGDLGDGWKHEVRALYAGPPAPTDPYQLDDDDDARFPNDTNVVILHIDRYWTLRGCEDICAALDAKPAPTEATAEPVMWFEAEASAKGQPLRHVIGSMLYSTRMHTTKPEVLNNALWPLYEHPAPTEAQGLSPVYAWLERSTRNTPAEVANAARTMMAFYQGAEFPDAAQGEDSARLNWLIENVSSGSIGFINGDFIGSQDFDELKVYIDRARASAETGGVKP